MALPVAAQAPTKAADFTVRDFAGKTVRLSDLQGKVVLLDFWATWCVPCQAEIPKFIEWQKRYGPQGLQVLAVSMDDSEVAARRFAKRFRLNYPVAMATPKLAESYGGVLGLPANFVINRKGEVVAKHIGLTDLETIERELKAELAKN
jgi:cytochrome c biogenesis protein CcmG/thiol:disulfide interchange protein DsbE